MPRSLSFWFSRDVLVVASRLFRWVERVKAFPVKMPSGGSSWTVIDDDYVVPVVDSYLRELRFGRDRAGSTTKAFGSHNR